jgi:DNA polymerase/3'-5' exonuclease PolX
MEEFQDLRNFNSDAQLNLYQHQTGYGKKAASNLTAQT